MLGFPSTTFLISLWLLIMLYAIGEGSVDSEGLNGTGCWNYRSARRKGSTIELPTYKVKDRQIQPQSQQGNSYTLPVVSAEQLQKAIESLVPTSGLDRNTRSMVGLPDYKNNKFDLEELGYRYKPVSAEQLQKAMESLMPTPGLDRYTRSLVGLPDYKIKKFVKQVKRIRQLGYRYKRLPVTAEQLQKAVKSLMQTPELGSSTSSDKIHSMFQTSRVIDLIANLFCFSNVLDPVSLTNISDDSQLIARDQLVHKCKEYGGRIIQESIYTEASITTENIEKTTKCYSRLPCFHCEEEVIQIRKGNEMVWEEFLQNASACESGQKAIPAATVKECFENGGSFIKSIQVPNRKIRCVSTECSTSANHFFSLLNVGEVEKVKLRSAQRNIRKNHRVQLYGLTADPIRSYNIETVL